MLPDLVCTVVLQGAGYLHLYCRLERAGLPVLGASLRASIELETGNGTVVGAPGRLLGDWGGGGEDTVAGDGIYSLTLAPPALGRYRFTVTASGDGVGLGPVEHYGPVVHLTQLPQADLLPPGRVRDLRLVAGASTNNTVVVVEWTSPGGDLHSGPTATAVFVFGETALQLARGEGVEVSHKREPNIRIIS